MDKINLLLGMTPSQYEMMLFDNWLKWCDGIATNQKDLQILLTETAVKTWYNLELLKREQNFVRIASRHRGYNSVSIEDIKACYHLNVSELNDKYPSALIKDLKIFVSAAARLKSIDPNYKMISFSSHKPQAFSAN